MASSPVRTEQKCAGVVVELVIQTAIGQTNRGHVRADRGNVAVQSATVVAFKVEFQFAGKGVIAARDIGPFEVGADTRETRLGVKFRAPGRSRIESGSRGGDESGQGHVGSVGGGRVVNGTGLDHAVNFEPGSASQLQIGNQSIWFRGFELQHAQGRYCWDHLGRSRLCRGRFGRGMVTAEGKSAWWKPPGSEQPAPRPTGSSALRSPPRSESLSAAGVREVARFAAREFR